ncbi:hypothetical protein M422DRAFT_264968 [Sphaerobolus stellatus SS14]|uniref:Terpene synthase n=1 Tax=Sphaerobolus stellatus (strain SS14) TaxID=990650 RepID=A0A0C9UV01_SPHS4|nr:hypothetical protein M422DRAFT_264968 [Sphaerobolus stellatus SS14]
MPIMQEVICEANRVRFEPELPKAYVLPNLLCTTEVAFKLKTSPHYLEAETPCIEWFNSFQPFPTRSISDNFINLGNFARLAGLSFPNAGKSRLETGLAFYLWGFSVDDFFDNTSRSPSETEKDVELNTAVTLCDSIPNVGSPSAAVLHDLLKQFREDGSPGMVKRSQFIEGFHSWSKALITQTKTRWNNDIPSVDAFILMRRSTIGAEMAKAVMEYTIGIDLPDHVFDDPIVQGVFDATTDILTWPNDLCSFNKEQADGDFQNLVVVIMHERGLDLQRAIFELEKMLKARVDDYISLKSRLPSFGPEIDTELGRYHENIEYCVQGIIQWHYESPVSTHYNVCDFSRI